VSGFTSNRTFGLFGDSMKTEPSLLAKIFLWVGNVQIIKAGIQWVDGDGSIPSFVLGLILVMIGNSLAESNFKKVQGAADEEAEDILARIRSGATPCSYVLYLRPFSTTDQIQKKNWGRITYAPSSIYKQQGFDLETTLAKILSPMMPFVALGRPGEHRGAGRIKTTEGEWRRDALLLMESAAVIFIVPGYQSGTKWELQHLRLLNCLQKTIFIMPYAAELDSAASFDAEEHWEVTKAEIKDIGFDMPIYASTGCLFSLNDDGSVAYQKQLASTSSEHEMMDDLRLAITVVSRVPVLT
jgi:hypothetical protein